MNAPRHEMILASAGSGKTYALTNRFVRLLAGGAEPERIVALTFTRKAAGEFFDEILKKLARAAAEPAFAAKLAIEIEAPQCRPEDFLKMLRAVVDAMARLQLGTLDGFFARVVRSFPLELGLGGEFQIMEEAAARSERRRVLRRMFTASGEPDAAQREFIEAFKRATFGVEEKQLSRVLDGFLDDHAETFLAAPVANRWGNAAQIWPDGNAWLAAVPLRATAEAALRAAVPWATLNDKQRVRWEDFFTTLAEWSPGAPLPKPVEYLLKNAFDAWLDLAEIVVERKKVSLSAPARAALTTVVSAIAGAELARRLEMTRGLFAVLHGYEETYHAAVRRAGRLTFADVLRLLLPDTGAPLLSVEAAGDARLQIDWRLDAKFDHWLLDEFQDTSFPQWSVLRNLIDEAVQDAEQRRSFFYVGDVKQAIFAWRGGDPRLFREIFEHYNRGAPDTIHEGRLDESWRSGPAVIAMVNRVFGDEPALRTVAPVPAVATWVRDWREHVSAKPQLGGFAELRHADDQVGRFAETLKILREVEPQRRGLSVAVLVRTNDTAAALADYLRSEGNLAAVAESDLHFATDNPLTGALLALLRAAAHPGDSLAQQHVQMSPVGTWLAREGVATGDSLTGYVLTEVYARGFAGALEHWLRKIAPAISGDEFSAERGRLLVGAAAKFDETGSRDVAEFLEFAERRTIRDTDTAGVVRVMTVHKAKGLGFDLVILPDLEGQTIAKSRDGLAVQHTADRAVEWVLELPAKIFTEHDPVLAAHAEAAGAEAAYENLCLLYVAMTRAKRAMYVVTEPPGKSTSKNFPRLLELALGETWCAGEAQWFVKLERDEATADRAGVNGIEPLASVVARSPRRASRRPSAEHAGVLAGAVLFSLGEAGTAAAEFGTAVHELLADVEWASADDAERLAVAWAERGADPAARDEAMACLRAPGLARVWKAIPQAEVWRERAFEVVLDGVWVTGVFDRVIVECDAGGQATRATVIDFKTDWITSDADIEVARARHEGQLALYRRVAARLTGIDEGRVAAELLLTRRRMTVRLD